MADISKAGVDPNIYQASTRSTGAPQARTNLTAQEAADQAGQDTVNDQVELGTPGQDAGVQTGMAQDLASQARRLGSARNALAAGGIQPGDVAPGEVPTAEAPAPPIAPTPPAADAQPDPAANAPTGAAANATGAATPADDPTPNPAPAPAPAPAGPQTAAATQAQSAQQDAQQANTIWMQMAADRQKWMMEMWKIWQDTQTAIMQIIQDVTTNRAKVQDQMMQAWDNLITGNK